MDFGGQDYPNPDNYAEPSFPQEVMAPLVEPDDFDSETIIVEYNIAWQPFLLGAADQLLQYSTWKGTNDDKLWAVDRATRLKWLLQVPAELAGNEYDTPYWDSETDVDDKAPADEQDWYGMVTNPSAPADELTFVENAVIWILTGFVALVLSPSLPVGAAAAVSFRTLATRFTLAFNRGDVREQFRVIIDAKDYGKVDTGDLDVGDIIELNVDGLEDLSMHDILIVATEIP